MGRSSLHCQDGTSVNYSALVSNGWDLVKVYTTAGRPTPLSRTCYRVMLLYLDAIRVVIDTRTRFQHARP